MTKISGRAFQWLRYLGLMLLVLLIVYAKPKSLLAILGEVNFWWLLLAFALNVPQLGIKAYRWHLNLKWQGIRLAYPRALLAYFSSLLVGFLTPGRLGELAKVLTLKYECGVPLARGASSVILDRVFDLYLLLALGSIGIVRYSLVGTVISSGMLIVLGLAFLAPLALMHAVTVRRLGHWLARRPLLAQRAAKIREKTDQFADGLAVFNFGRVLICILLTAASYSIFFLQCLMCAWALHFTAAWLDMVFLMAATNLVTFIPITISGLGTREACLIYFLARIQPPQGAPVAVAFGLVIFMVFFVGGGLLGFLCWQWSPIGLRQAARAARAAKIDTP